MSKAKRPATRDQQSQTGSDAPDGPVFIAVGKVRRPHGVRGEVKVEILTDFPERLQSKKEVFVGSEDHPHKIRSIRPHTPPVVIMSFEGLDSLEDVEWMRTHYLLVRAESLPELPDGEYYFHQLLGLQVFDVGGEFLGSLSDILETGANDVYVVKAEDGAEILIPAIESSIIGVDLAAKRMTVRKLEYF
jgi:16S rRNA processing protein RimM